MEEDGLSLHLLLFSLLHLLLMAGKPSVDLLSFQFHFPESRW